MNIKFEDHSKEILDAISSIDGKTGDLFPESFMKENTSFSSLDSMINEFGNVESVEDLSNNTDWDKFVSVNSSFNNWDEMLGAAKENLNSKPKSEIKAIRRKQAVSIMPNYSSLQVLFPRQKVSDRFKYFQLGG